MPFAIHALEGGAQGRGRRRERRARRAATASCRRARRRTARRVRSFAELSRTPARALRDPGPRRARGAHRRQARGRRERRPFDDHGLREEWRDLVEYPTVMVGEVPQEFRALPPEVLETVLVHHQKYIALRDGGRPHRPLRGRDERRRRGGAARSRGAWSAWSWRACATRRSSWPRTASARSPSGVADLAGVTFHQGLGTLPRQVGADGDARRGHGAAGPAGRRRARGGDAGGAAREGRPRHAHGARVPRAAGRDGRDLPRGRGRARRGGHGRALALPPDRGRAGRRAGRGLRRAGTRRSRVFAAVALADKLDTLAGYFGLGESPTGSRDPYGLRRAGQGAVRAVLDFWRPKAGEKAPDLRGARGGRGRGLRRRSSSRPTRRPRRVQAFLLDRLEYVLSARGFAADEVAAVVARRRTLPRRSRDSGPDDAWRRVEALQRVRREVPEDFAAPGRGLQAREEHPRAGRRRPRRSIRRSSRPTPSARSSRPHSGLEQAAGLLRGPPAGPRLSPRPGRALLRRRARHGRGRARARRTGSLYSSRRSRSSTASRTFPVSEVHRDPVRLLLRRRQGGRQQGHEGHSRRQGRGPRRDDERRRARAARLHDLHRRPATPTTTAAGKLPAEVDQQMDAALAKLEALQGKKLGDAADPLLVSVRSGSKFSMPGMMDTILNLGMNDQLGRGPEGQDRQRPLRQGQLPPLHPDVRQRGARDRQGEVRARALGAQEEVQGEDRRRARREGPRRGDRALQGRGGEGDRTIPSRRTRASSWWAPATPSSSRG